MIRLTNSRERRNRRPELRLRLVVGPNQFKIKRAGYYQDDGFDTNWRPWQRLRENAVSSQRWWSAAGDSWPIGICSETRQNLRVMLSVQWHCIGCACYFAFDVLLWEISSIYLSFSGRSFDRKVGFLGSLNDSCAKNSKRISKTRDPTLNWRNETDFWRRVSLIIITGDTIIFKSYYLCWTRYSKWVVREVRSQEFHSLCWTIFHSAIYST